MEDDKKIFLEGLQNFRDKKLKERQMKQMEQRAMPDRSQNLAKGQLDKDVLQVKSSASPDVTPEITKVKGTANVGPNVQKQTVMKGQDWADKIDDIKLKGNLKATMQDAISRGDKTMISKLQQVAEKFGRNAGKGLKSIPILGSAIGLASAIGSDDASAAIPVLDSAESLGPQKGSLDYKLESGEPLTPEEQQELKRQSLLNMKNMQGR